MRSTFYKECNCEKFFFPSLRIFQFIFYSRTQISDHQVSGNCVGKLNIPPPSSAAQLSGQLAPPLPTPAPSSFTPPTTTTQSLLSDGLNSPSTVHTLRLERSSWFSPQGAQGCVGPLEMLEALLVPVSHFVVNNLLYFFFFFTFSVTVLL